MANLSDARSHSKINPADDTKGGVIYALIDPRPERLGQVRYIGKSEDFGRRRRDYRQAFARERGHSRPLRHWFKKLKRLGYKPQFKILDECLFGLCSLEREWIARGRKKKWPLLNIQDGGEGHAWTDEAKQLQSAFGKEKWKDPEYRLHHEASMAAHRGMTVEQYRAWRAERQERRQQNIRRNQANMALAARRAAEREGRKTWVFVPLTCRGAAFVPLTQGKWAVIDADDWQRVGRYKWSSQEKGDYWRAKRNGPKVGGVACIILLNRFIMDANPRQEVSHANGRQLDCRRSNLIIGRAKQRTSAAPPHREPTVLRDMLHRLDNRLVRWPHDERLMQQREHVISLILNERVERSKRQVGA